MAGLRLTTAVAASLLLATGLLGAQETITRGTRLAADVARDGRIAIDLEGEIWIVSRDGGEARPTTRGIGTARRPRWSPDASCLAFEATVDGEQRIMIHDLTTSESRSLSRGPGGEFQPAWHPDGERLVYAADRRDSGLDLWEVDLPTGLHWRLSSRRGDETEPAWSADGRNLVYIHHEQGRWSLVLRRHGLAEETLLTAGERLYGPSWRPDGSLISFFRDRESGSTLEIAILSEPRLVRTYEGDERFDPAAVAWQDRQRMIYTVDGRLRERRFDAWSSSPLPFRATRPEPPAAAIERRPLPRIDEPGGKLVIHAARLFDGLGGGYQQNRDIIIEGGRIAAVTAHADHQGLVAIDLGDLAVLPGYVDADSRLPASVDDSFGSLLLATGVTTIVADHEDAARLDALWSGKDLPGPRLLGRQDWPAATASAIADAVTPGLDRLLQSRQARLIGIARPVARRFAEAPRIESGTASVVLGSRGNGLPAGLATHAEFRAQAAAGLRPEQSLRAAGVNAAAALGADPYLGRIAVGAVADLVFVDGDPLGDIEDALKVVAVVRNGRFFSAAGLIERANAASSVE